MAAIYDTYREYAEFLLAYHRLLSDGKDETAETAAVEDKMTELWERLDAAQRSSLSGLGSDFNWVRRRAAPAPRGRKPEDVTPQDCQALVQAKEAEAWHHVLHYLRMCGPKTPPCELAHLRASSWAALEMPKIASVFFDFAAELDAGKG